KKINGHNQRRNQADVKVGGIHDDERERGIGEKRQKVYENVLDEFREAFRAAVDSHLKFSGRVFVVSKICVFVGENFFDGVLGKSARKIDSNIFAEHAVPGFDGDVDEVFAEVSRGDGK